MYSTSKKKNLLIIISSLKKGGGAENVAYYQANLDTTFNIQYLTFYNHSNSYKPKTNVTCLNERFSKNIFLQLKKILTRTYHINNFCKTNNIHTTIAHMEESAIPLILSTLLFRNNTKTIACIHQSLKNAHGLLYRVILSFLYLRTSKIVGVSKGLLNDLFLKKYLRQKYVTIYNALDLDFIKKRKNMHTNGRSQVSKSVLNFISIGRLSKEKNYPLLIESLSTIKTDYLSIIVGDGLLKNKINSLIRQKGVQDKVHLLGYSNNVFELLKRSDIFLLTSNHEGFGIAIIEAMACGVPIISTDCEHGPREIIAPTKTIRHDCFEIGTYGILVPTNNPDCFRRAILYLMNNNPLMQQLQKKGLQRVKSFDLTVILNKWTDTIIKLS